MSESTTVVPIDRLVEDLTIYPRCAVDDQHVRALLDALRVGVTLPPPIIDAVSSRIVDGWHRVRAYRHMLGPTGSIEVIARTYASEAELIADAVRCNASHGRRLSRVDQVRSILLLEQAGVDHRAISAILRVPEERVQSLRVRVAYVDGGQPEPLKRPVLHLRGQLLTAEQAAVHRELGGISFTLHARQLRRAIEAGLIDQNDALLMAELATLARILVAFVPVHGARETA